MNLDPQLLGVPEQCDIPGNQADHSGLRLFPPPLFSRQAIPQGYKYIYFFPEAF
jgi:general transcription factor 3C polypeptide 5 (transcription factor C subunit 1)